MVITKPATIGPTKAVHWKSTASKAIAGVTSSRGTTPGTMVMRAGMAMAGAVRKAMPYIQPVGTWLMIIAGTYIVFYWLTLGGLLDKLS